MKIVLALTLASLSQFAISAQTPIQEMPVFTSDAHTHALDILMIAKAKPIELAGMHPTAWVYEVCRRAVAAQDACPAGEGTVAPYGGVRLQLQPGDHLRIRLVNELPPAPQDDEHVYDGDPMMQEMLSANPTNLHTHGLIVEPRKADASNPTFGDYIYVLGYPAGKKPKMGHPGWVYTDKPIDYDIYIPKNHPSGIFWFHPHVHGLSLNQVSEGLTGMITIGNPDSYLGDQPKSYGLHGNVLVRNLLLKDIEVDRNDMVVDEEDPDFCRPDPKRPDHLRKGFCDGVKAAPNSGETDYSGGRWIFSVSGQVYPTDVIENRGEVWRLASGSGSRGYALALRDDDTGELLPFQILAIDGVSIDAKGETDDSHFAAKLGNRIEQAPCAEPDDHSGLSRPVCATVLRMMPSARTAIFIPSYIRGSRHASFITQSLNTGPAGDDWPSVGLIHVVFTGHSNGHRDLLEVKPQSTELLGSGGLLASEAKISIPGFEDSMSVAEAAKLLPFASHANSLADPSCKALAPGHTRRIFFGVPTGQPDAFGLGYEELDERGNPVPGTFKDIAPFDHLTISVCLPLAKGNMPVTERWQLINVSGEDHNFHLHQTRFTVLTKNAPDGDAREVMDNVPLFTAGASCDGSVSTWRSGGCPVAPVEVEIPFAEIGDFVYHCHILEHEDGGMMAHIRVVAHP